MPSINYENKSAFAKCIASAGPPWQRRLFHATAGSAIPVAALFLPDSLPAVLLGILAAGSLALDLARFRVGWLNRLFLRFLSRLLKSDEDRRITGATYMLIGAGLAFALFDRPVVVAVLLFLSLGDPAAALIGRPMPGPRPFGKSPVGTLAFIAVSLLVVAVLVMTGVTGFQWVFLVGAVVAGLVELAPLPFDDNLTVPLIAGTVIQYLPLLTSLSGSL